VIQRKKGFTLIELMIVVAIVAILSAIAYPSYRKYVMRSNRGEAKAVLMELAQYMERNYTLSNAYNKLGSSSAAAGSFTASSLPYSQVPKTGAVNYNISFTTLDASNFTMVATPTGSQTADECGKLTVNQLGQNGIDTSSSGSSSATAENCWRR
jgi:type IV pilus assembly protein PilE